MHVEAEERRAAFVRHAWFARLSKMGIFPSVVACSLRHHQTAYLTPSRGRHICFSNSHFIIQLNSLEVVFALSNLLDRPWSQVPHPPALLRYVTHFCGEEGSAYSHFVVGLEIGFLREIALFLHFSTSQSLTIVNVPNATFWVAGCTVRSLLLTSEILLLTLKHISGTFNCRMGSWHQNILGM